MSRKTEEEDINIYKERSFDPAPIYHSERQIDDSYYAHRTVDREADRSRNEARNYDDSDYYSNTKNYSARNNPPPPRDRFPRGIADDEEFYDDRTDSARIYDNHREEERTQANRRPQNLRRNYNSRQPDTHQTSV